MEIRLNIPDEVAAEIQNGSNTPLDRRVLELAAIQAHEAGLITEREVMEMLGSADREELYKFFKRYDVRSEYTTAPEARPVYRKHLRYSPSSVGAAYDTGRSYGARGVCLRGKL